jgi:hypothetical protein
MPSPLYYSHFAASNTVHNNDERYTWGMTHFDETELW